MSRGPLSVMDRLLPALVGLVGLGAWEAGVRLGGIPPYLLPAPSLIALTLVRDWAILGPSLAYTLTVTAAALAVAAVGGGGLALLFAASPRLARALMPYALILQVTPIVSVAPLIIIWVDDTRVALVLCASIVAFFPVLANARTGLDSAEPTLIELFRLYGASRWQTLWRLRLPTALPFFLAGLRIAGGLSLVGAVVAEFVAGAGGHDSGLAYRILEAGYRLDLPRMFAALTLVGLTGITLYAALERLSRWLLRPWGG